MKNAAKVMGGRMSERVGGWVDGWTGGCKDGRVSGWVDGHADDGFVNLKYYVLAACASVFS